MGLEELIEVDESVDNEVRQIKTDASKKRCPCCGGGSVKNVRSVIFSTAVSYRCNDDSCTMHEFLIGKDEWDRTDDDAFLDGLV